MIWQVCFCNRILNQAELKWLLMMSHTFFDTVLLDLIASLTYGRFLNLGKVPRSYVVQIDKSATSLCSCRRLGKVLVKQIVASRIITAIENL